MCGKCEGYCEWVRKNIDYGDYILGGLYYKYREFCMEHGISFMGYMDDKCRRVEEGSREWYVYRAIIEMGLER